MAEKLKSKLVVALAGVSACVASVAFGGAARVDTIQFPKEKPAFSIEVPAETKQELTKDWLSIALNRETHMVVREVSSDVHDDESARKYLFRAVDDYLGQGIFYSGLDRMVETPNVPHAKEALSAGAKIKGFHLQGTIGNQRRMGNSYDTLGYSAWIFSCDDKRYFMVKTDGDRDVVFDKEQVILDSISARK